MFSQEFSLEPLICYLKIDVSCEASVNLHHISQNAMPATEFAPCRHLTHPWQCDSHKTRNTTRLKCCACHAKWRWTRPKCCACHEKLQLILRKRRKSIAPATQNDFRHVTKHVWMSRSATPATRNEATRRLKPPKMTPSAELTIGTAIRGSRERLRTVANGWATSSEHTLNPQTPRVKQEPFLRIREKGKNSDTSEPGKYTQNSGVEAQIGNSNYAIKQWNRYEIVWIGDVEAHWFNRSLDLTQNLNPNSRRFCLWKVAVCHWGS